MSERLRNLLFVVAIALTALVTVVLVSTTPTEADRVEALGSRIKCPVCQGESIADSPAQMARDMMALVSQRVEEGASDEAIVEELLGSYSGAVLLDPPAAGSTLVLWLAPGLAILAGLLVIYRWRRHPPARTQPKPDTEIGPSKKRTLVGGLILAGALAVTVIVAGFSLQERDGPNAGVAALGEEDLSEVSVETMAAIIAANPDNPQIDGMRLALAERLFDQGDYRGAFPHYLAVAESSQATRDQVVAALIRLGWMAWDGNQEAEAAIGLLDQALEIAPSSTTAKYLKGQILWCGTGDHEEAASLFGEVLGDDELPEESRDAVEGDLAAVQHGETCT